MGGFTNSRLSEHPHTCRSMITCKYDVPGNVCRYDHPVYRVATQKCACIGRTDLFMLNTVKGLTQVHLSAGSYFQDLMPLGEKKEKPRCLPLLQHEVDRPLTLYCSGVLLPANHYLQPTRAVSRAIRGMSTAMQETRKRCR